MSLFRSGLLGPRRGFVFSRDGRLLAWLAMLISRGRTVQWLFGDDSGRMSFYDKNGFLLEQTPEIEPWDENDKPKTGVENCFRTTEDYFKSKVVNDCSVSPCSR